MGFKTSKGTEVRNPILLLMLPGFAFISGTVPASTTVTEVTITFNDTLDALFVYTSGSGSASCGLS